MFSISFIVLNLNEANIWPFNKAVSRLQSQGWAPILRCTAVSVMQHL